MQIKILGCSGVIGGDLRTTSLLEGHDILMDAGSGVGDSTMDELLVIDHFLSRTPISTTLRLFPCCWNRDEDRTQPVTLHATQEVLNLLHTHIFNWV